MLSQDDRLRSFCSKNISDELLYNLSCLEEIYDLIRYDKPYYSELELGLFAAAYIIITIFGVLGNGLVIFAVVRKPAMRTSRNVLLTNLAVSNFLLALSLYPFLWLPTIHGSFPFGRFFCKTVNALPGSNIYCSTLTISMMAMDRYYAVRHTSSSMFRISRTQIAAISAGMIWLIAFLLSSPLLIFNDIVMFPEAWNSLKVIPNGTIHSLSWPICDFASSTGDNVTLPRVVNILQTSFLYLIPLLVLAIFNTRLTRYLNQNTMRRKLPSGRRESHAVKAAEQRSSRATRLVNAMALSYAALWFPFTLISFLFDFNLIRSNGLVRKLDDSAKLISMTSICVNPFLYGFLNTNFNREFAEILSKIPGCAKLSSASQTDTARLNRAVCVRNKAAETPMETTALMRPSPQTTASGSFQKPKVVFFNDQPEEELDEIFL